VNPHERNVGVALGTLLASGTTLVCCVLPAVLVSLGAGGTMVALVSAVPQLVWLSERKSVVFSIAALLLISGAMLLWRARSQPCPADAVAAGACRRLRRIANGVYAAAVILFLIGATFTYVLPALQADT
jgi:hypothetical protein